MIIRIDDVPEDGLELSLTGTHDILSNALENVPTSNDLRIDPEVRGFVRLLRSEEDIFFTARVQARLHLRCSRCLADFALDKELDLHLVVRVVPAAHPDEAQFMKSDPNQIWIHEPEIDVGGIIVQEILLEAPMKPLCTEECPGLCQHCGALKGSEHCTCPAENRVDARWEPLARLKKKMNS